MTKTLLITTTLLAATAAFSCKDLGGDPPSSTWSATGDGDGGSTAGPSCGDGNLDDGEYCDGSAAPVGLSCSTYGWGDGTIACTAWCTYTGCTDFPDGGAGFDEGADDTAGADDGPGCDDVMLQYDCQGMGYAVYRHGTDEIMQVAGADANFDKVVTCIGDSASPTDPDTVEIEVSACGPNSPAATVDEMLRQQCNAECETKFAPGDLYPETIDVGGVTWAYNRLECFFAGDEDDWGVGINNAMDLHNALGIFGCGYSPLELPQQVADAQPGPTPCGGTACAVIDCSEYDVINNVGQVTSGRTIKSWVDSTFAAVIQEDTLIPFCGEGLYAWDSDEPTRAHFDGLGAGELFYSLGFRTGDRLLAVQEYIPATGDPSTGTLTGSVYPLTTQMEMLAAAVDLDLFASGEHYFRISFKRGWSTYYNWVRILDIAT